MELQTLVEEDETIEQLPVEQETQYLTPPDHSWRDHMIQDTPTLSDDQMLLDNQVLVAHSSEEASNRTSVRDSVISNGTNRLSAFNVSCNPHQ